MRPLLLPGLGAALLVLLALALTAKLGPTGLVVLLALVLAVLLLDRPRLAAGVAIGLAVAIEPDPEWGHVGFAARIYAVIPGAKVSPVEVLVVLALVAALLHRHGRGLLPLAPTPFSVPLSLLALGLVAGVITGHDAGAGAKTIFNASRNALPVVIVPFVLVQVIDSREALRRALWIAGALGAFKGLAGTLAVGAGMTPAGAGSGITYYEAPANMVTLGFLCVAMGAMLTRAGPPRWFWQALPFVLGSLVLSFRRAFWIASVVGLVVVGLVTLGRDGRRFAIPLAVIATILLALVLSSGTGQLSGAPPAGSGDSSSLGGRLASINPTAISANEQDRYRIGERRNVLADLRETPLTGLGFGVPWRARYPVSIGFATHEYVHFGALWWWMKTGIFGLVGYVWLLVATAATALVVRRDHNDPLVRAAALGAAGATVGYSVAEFTATYSGPDVRSSIVLGALVGLVAVAWREAREDEGACVTGS